VGFLTVASDNLRANISGEVVTGCTIVTDAIRACTSWGINARIFMETTVLQGVLTSILHRMEVVLMKNQNHFDFKDMMTFGLFLLALLTFVFTFCK
jgi:hypothetical protein